MCFRFKKLSKFFIYSKSSSRDSARRYLLYFGELSKILMSSIAVLNSAACLILFTLHTRTSILHYSRVL